MNRDDVVGASMDRVDGPEKVTGRARYPADVPLMELVHAVIVGSTVASGRVVGFDTSSAEAASGVLALMTCRNAPVLQPGPETWLGAPAPLPLQDDTVHFHGQPVGVVVAATLEQASAAAALVHVVYAENEPLLAVDDPRARPVHHPVLADVARGDVAAALAAAEVCIDATYTTPTQHHNPVGLFATTANWQGDSLTVHDTTQWPGNVRVQLAAAFSIPVDQVRVVSRFVGGAFGAGLRMWPHVILAALAARQVNRPVKLVLTRAQMFTSVGYRPPTVQQVRLGATRAGKLTAIEHEGTEPVAMEDNFRENLVRATPALYACSNLSARIRQVRLNVPNPTWMRGPGESQGVFALESAMDELAYELDIDPVDLRLRNYADRHPQTGLAWSTNALRKCYELGAASFGWAQRSAAPRSMRDGGLVVGWGMASAYYPYVHLPTEARVCIFPDGHAEVQSATTDIGTGTYTIMTQVAADALGLRPELVRVELGDTDLPPAPQQGGSATTAGVGSAVYRAAQALKQAFLDVVRDDSASPLTGCALHQITVHNGFISRSDAPDRGETYIDILGRHGLTHLAAQAISAPSDDNTLASGIFGAKFVEVRFDPDIGSVAVTRVVAAIDGGRILNEKTARSQIIGGTIGGIGQALYEQTSTDSATGRVVNATFADYLVPALADTPAIDVLFVGEPDPLNPIGVKGVGEIAIVGVAPAIANAVYHATGKRIRDLPITIEKLL